jgi:hypothetical protein
VPASRGALRESRVASRESTGEGVVVDLAERIILDALARVAGRPDGLPLFAARAGAGLFKPSIAGKQAARRCLDAGLVRVVRRELRGKNVQEICDITDQGLAYLLEAAARLRVSGSQASDDAGRAIRVTLEAWHRCGALGDCPLPELFRRLRDALPSLTIGQFHDRLRLLHHEGAIYLHPWTGPLYELPEPAIALLVGHEIAYYASLRA